ncbi:serine hydrolase domain-containing protein [Hymenobacter sp. YC55]|uniref:serine hydrolase domain-containing protein n=1 Tax=Hymenobacter sp. YC55 TaxID=3034019 RepID=UPI0023F83F10|nr:serine hydrolase domain-containing protein [Hymenobacter sp. YC55]MDF7815039.1 serine hydrolase [Hymenobacter sp. YC55]
MKTVCLGLLLALGACTPVDFVAPATTCTAETSINPSFSKAAGLRQVLQHYAAAGLPGCVVAVYSPTEGYWADAAGFAQIENRTPMQVCHLQYGQSVAKTYAAAALLLLYEEGKVQLDAPITDYLPATLSRKLPDAQKITVRMLLNHTSGLPDYSSNADYIAYLLQHPKHRFSSADYLDFLTGSKLEFKPGSKFSYSNTNYLLVALITDAIHGNHVQLIQDRILAPLGLQRTFYHNTPNYLRQPDVVNSYFERYGNGRVENVSQMQQINVETLYGDDGIVASPLDYVNFLRALMEDRLLKPSSRQLMMSWVNDPKTGQPKYGMGLYHIEHQGQVAYGHGGAGLGAGCALYYLPDKQLYFFLGVNMGTLTEGKLVSKTGELRDAVLDELVK